MLNAFGKNIWIADGPKIVASAGFHYPTRMAAIKLANGNLFIWSPVALTTELQSQIKALGRVDYLIAPNSLHHMCLPEWINAFPNAKVYAAPGLREKRRDIEFHGDLGQQPDAAWVADIDQVVMEGNIITQEVVFFHRGSQTVLFTDFLQQLPSDWFSGWRRTVAKLDLMLGDEPTVPRKVRMSFSNKKKGRSALERILVWPIENVLMAHGTPVKGNGAEFLKRAFKRLRH